MRSFRARITLKSAFGTIFMGDTLFGQLCWSVRNRDGDERLSGLLDGYNDGQPFVVVSDAFPADYIPRPALPGHWFREVPFTDRKTAKKRIWLPLERFHVPLEEWLEYCQPADEIHAGSTKEYPQPHNTLNRHSGTTGEGQFAPYAMNQLWYGHCKTEVEKPSIIRSPIEFDIYVVLDEDRLSADELKTLLADIGMIGFGRDASIGLGKYEINTLEAFDLPVQERAHAWLTLAPCAPQGMPWQVDRCFYQPFTRFGRHGDVAVHGGNPFKTPLLLANTGAVLTPTDFENKLFTGQGLGGDGSLSKSITGTVHQGYSPILGVTLPASKKEEEVA